jgi:hypothetical protein
MDATLPAKVDANMPSDSQQTGGGGSNPVVPIKRDSIPESANWECVDDNKPGWETADKKTGSEWELTDRIED